MKAIRVHEFGDPDQLRLETTPDPVVSEGQVGVKVFAAGINPVDTYIRSGTYAVKPELPYTPGFDGAGEVVELGKGVEGLELGERVYFGGTLTGAYAERAVCDPARVYRLPDGSSFSEGACVAVPYGTAHRALVDRARVQPGERVLIHGATGGVGTAAVQIARGLGCDVFATGGSEAGRALVSSCGAHEVFDHHSSDYLDEIISRTGGQGVDVILEMLADVNLGNDLTALAPGGRVVIIGSRGTVELNPRDAMVRNAAILGMVLLSATAEQLSTTHRAIFAGLDNRSLRPIVGQELGLVAAPEAHRKVMEPGASGNIVLLTAEE